MKYEEFRTGLSYEDVWRMMWVAGSDRTTWARKSPGAVLSLWRKIKQDMWDEMIARGLDPESLPPPPRRKRLQAASKVPPRPTCAPPPPPPLAPAAAAAPAGYVPSWMKRKATHVVGRWAQNLQRIVSACTSTSQGDM